MSMNDIFSILSYCRKYVARVILGVAFGFLMCGLPLNCTGSDMNCGNQSLAFKPLKLEIAKGINTFSWNYLKELGNGPIADNGVASPQSIYQCVGMSYIASGGGTRKQLAAVVGLPESNATLLADARKLNEAMNMKFTKEASIVISNGVWLDRTYAKFQPDYIEQLQENFMTSPKECSLSDSADAIKDINAWVSKKTDGKISDIISPDDLKSKSGPGVINEPCLVLVNAIYFYSPWASGFNKKETQKLPFTLPDGSKSNVEMMHQYGELGYAKGSDFAVLRLGYKNVPFSMYVILPDKVMAAGELVKWAVANKELRGGIPKTSPYNVDVLLPKFSLASQYDVKHQLENMGVSNAFSTSEANFDTMIKNSDDFRIYVSTIRQKATIDVNEEGTEATAATCSISYSFACAAPPMPPCADFHADRPFVFMIVHEPSATILFNGWVTKP